MGGDTDAEVALRQSVLRHLRKGAIAEVCMCLAVQMAFYIYIYINEGRLTSNATLVIQFSMCMYMY